jgi:hypothetical protein
VSTGAGAPDTYAVASASAPADPLFASVLSFLRSHGAVTGVRVQERRPVTAAALAAWELAYGVRLPADLRSFYLAAGDGLDWRWSLRLGGRPLPAGRLHLNQLPVSRHSQVQAACVTQVEQGVRFR